MEIGQARHIAGKLWEAVGGVEACEKLSFLKAWRKMEIGQARHVAGDSTRIQPCSVGLCTLCNLT